MSNENYKVEVREGKLILRGQQTSTDYPVSDAFQEDDKIIVLFDPDSKTGKFGQFPNLIAIDRRGQKIWTAQLPTTETGDAYYRISSRKPLIAYSVCSYSCEIDTQTGKIKQKIFYK